MNIADSITETKSYFEQIEEQMMEWAREALPSSTVNLDVSFEDMSIGGVEELRARAINKVQVLFDFFGQSPVVDPDRRSATERLQKDVLEYGFFVAYAATRKDGGYLVRKIAFRVIHKLRKTFFNKKLVMDMGSAQVGTYAVRLVSILREEGVEGLCIYRVTFTSDIPIQFR